jgi:hypothetical protein
MENYIAKLEDEKVAWFGCHIADPERARQRGVRPEDHLPDGGEAGAGAKTGPFVYLVTWSPNHLVTGSPGHRVTWSPGHLVTL